MSLDMLEGLNGYVVLSCLDIWISQGSTLLCSRRVKGLSLGLGLELIGLLDGNMYMAHSVLLVRYKRKMA